MLLVMGGSPSGGCACVCGDGVEGSGSVAADVGEGGGGGGGKLAESTSDDGPERYRLAPPDPISVRNALQSKGGATRTVRSGSCGRDACARGAVVEAVGRKADMGRARASSSAPAVLARGGTNSRSAEFLSAGPVSRNSPPPLFSLAGTRGVGGPALGSWYRTSASGAGRPRLAGRSGGEPAKSNQRMQPFGRARQHMECQQGERGVSRACQTGSLINFGAIIVVCEWPAWGGNGSVGQRAVKPRGLPSTRGLPPCTSPPGESLTTGVSDMLRGGVVAGPLGDAIGSDVTSDARKRSLADDGAMHHRQFREPAK